jgi:hypothetical protein
MKLGQPGQQDDDRQRILLRLLFALLLGLALISHSRYVYPQTTQGRTWTIEPGIGINGTYTDNVALAPQGTEENEFATQLNFFVTANADTARQKTSIGYRMQNIFYAQDTSGDQTFNQLDARGNVRAWGESFFLDWSSTISQQVIDPTQTLPTDNVTITDNRTNVGTLQVSPFWTQEIGGGVRALLRYTGGIVRYDEKLQDTNNNIGQFRIGSVAERRLSWQLDYVNNRVKFVEEDTINRFERIGLDLGYLVTPATTLTALIGYEDNEFETNVTTEPTEGSFWAVGILWQPSRRNELELRYGERFFGRTGSFQWTFQGRILTTNFTYTENFTTAGQVQLDTPVTPGSGVTTDPPQFRDQVFFSQRFSGELTVSLRKTELAFNAFNERQEFQVNLDENEVSGIGMSWVWQFAPRTSSRVNLRFQRNDFITEQQEDELSQANFFLQRQIGRRTSAGLGITYNSQNSTEPQNEYRQNLVNLRFAKRF